MALIRKLLFKIEEERHVDIGDDDHTRGNLRLMIEGGLIHGEFGENIIDSTPFLFWTMTWAGHDFLDSVRDEGVWSKVTTAALKMSGGVSFGVLTALAKDAAMTALGLKE